MKDCSFPGCGRPRKSRGWCAGHALQIKEGRDLAPLKVLIKGRGCLFGGCTRPHYAGGYCNTHHRQLSKGKPLTPVLYRPKRTREQILARDASGRKQCGHCLEWKPEARFSKCSVNVDGLQARCRACIAKTKLASRYNLTTDEFDALVEAQGDRCAICRRPSPGGRGEWHIDHDHGCCPRGRSCGKCVRGLLCASCNHMLGMAGDDPAVLTRAIAYLEKAMTK